MSTIMTSQFDMTCRCVYQFDWRNLSYLVTKSWVERTNINKVIVDWPKIPPFQRTFEGWFGPTVKMFFFPKSYLILIYCISPLFLSILSFVVTGYTNNRELLRADVALYLLFSSLGRVENYLKLYCIQHNVLHIFSVNYVVINHVTHSFPFFPITG